VRRDLLSHLHDNKGLHATTLLAVRTQSLPKLQVALHAQINSCFIIIDHYKMLRILPIS